MKREDLKKLGLTDEQIDAVMAENGKDVEKFKSEAATAKTEVDGLKTQLTEASTAIEGFKKLDPEGVKKQADEWKTKAETAEAEGKKQVDLLKFEHALDGALSGAKAKNPKAARALLNMADLKLGEDGSIVGLKDQLEKIQKENDYLFESDTPAPKIVAGGTPKPNLTDPFSAAVLKGAGLTPKGD